jgi:hypothetical protein
MWGDSRKQIQGRPRPISTPWRTFEHPYISILALHRRDDDTYDEDVDVEFLGGLDVEGDEAQAARATQPAWELNQVVQQPDYVLKAAHSSHHLSAREQVRRIQRSSIGHVVFGQW